MKSKNSPLSSLAFSVTRAAALMAVAATPGAYALSATWTGGTDATWATAGNWSTSPVPGTLAGETATFNGAGGADDVINLGAGVTIRSVVFDTAAAAAYTIGTGAAGSQTLTLEGTGSIALNAAVVQNQLVNANLNLGTIAGAEAFTVTNSKAAATNNLTLAGGISTTQTGTKTLTVAGTGITNISGAITNGSGTVALAKTGAHVLTLSGASSYSGGTTLTTGIISATNNTALGSGPVTIGNTAGNQLQLANGLTVGNALSIAGGGVTAQGILYVPTGNATYTGTINITANPAAGGHFAAPAGILTISGDNTITSTVAVSARGGITRYTGSQNYASGTSPNGGMIQFGKTSSMPATGTVTVGNTSSIGANVGGVGEFTLGAGTTTAGTIGGLLGGVGGQSAPVTWVAGSSIGIDTTNAVGTQTFTAAFTTPNNVGLTKLGAGTLELTNGGTYNGGGAVGFPLVARQGTLKLNGGTHTANGEVVVGGNFGTAAGAAGYDATLQLDAGSLVTNNWLSIGRGNGTGGVSSDLVLNNAASVTAANFSAGFNAGNGANLPKGTITLNGTSGLTLSGNAQMNLAESPGSNMTMTLNGSSTLTAAGTGIKYLGQGGTGTLNINNSAAVSFGTGMTYIGYRAATGKVEMTGGTWATGGEVRVGGSDVSGADAGTGTFNLSGGSANLNALTLGRGNNNAALLTGTANVSGGSLTVQTNVILGYAGASGTLGKMTISGSGVVNVGPTAAQTLVMSTFDTAKSQIDISGGSLNIGNSSSIKCFTGNVNTSGTATFNQTGGAVTFYSDAGTTVGGTGVLDLAFAGSATSVSTYNLNGGTLTVPAITATNNSGTRLFNFNGGTLKAAVNGTLLNLGSSSATYRANVRDGGAIIDTNNHVVSIPQALEASNVSGDAATGGLTKIGAGTLSLTSFSNTYTGVTNVDAGTLDLQGTLTSNIVVKSGATIAGSGSTSGSLTLQGGSTLAPTPSTSFSLVASGGVNITGPTNLVFNGTPTNGQAYVLFNYGAGGITGIGNLSSSGYRTVIQNDSGNQQVTGTVTTGNLIWNTNTGTWAVNTGGWTNGFTSFFNGDTVTFNERASASTVTINGPVLPASVTVNNTTNPYTFTGSGSIGGETSLIKNGAGALTLATANTYTGGTTLNAGSLNLNNASALGTGTLTVNGGTLDNTSGNAIAMTGNFPQVWNADINFTGSSSLDMGAGAVSMADMVLTDRTVTVAANTLGVGEITSALGLTKQGAGTLVVASVGVQAASSSLGGALNVAAGTLQINRSGVDGNNSGDFTATAITGTGAITNGAAAERWLFINTTAANTFSGTLANGGTGGLGFAKQGTGSIILNGTLSYTGTTTVDAGTLSIPVANSGTGTGAVVNGGFLILGNPTALGTPAVPATPNIIRIGGTATLDLAHDGGGPTYGFASNTAANANIIANRATTGAGITHTLTTVGNAGAGGGTLNFTSGANATSGTSRVSFTQFGLADNTVQTTILNPTTAEVSLGAVTKVANTTVQTLELGGTTTDNQITGLISNGTATGVALAKTNSSTWTISGANNTFTGGTKVGNNNGAGVLRVTATAALGTGAIAFDGSGGAAPGGPTSRLELAHATGITLANAITLNQRNNATAAILNVSGNNTLSGTIDLQTGGTRANIQSDAGLLTLSGPVLTTTAVARSLYLGGAGNGLVSNSISNGTGTLNLTKEGAGTWTLTSASNIYTGTTTVSGGTLSMSQATLSNTAAVTVAAGAFLNLTHNATDTVDRFFIDGVEQVAGTWGSLTSAAAHKTERITGTGIINATNGATPPAGGFSNWATALGLTTENGVGDNPDGDGFDNGIEYILGGHPKDGSNNPKVFTKIADSSDAGTDKDLIMTIAVPQGTPAFPAGSPTSSVTFENFGITVRGSTNLATFPVVVTPVNPEIAGTFTQGGITYEYRSFSLDGSNGLAGKGFLQVTVTNPTP